MAKRTKQKLKSRTSTPSKNNQINNRLYKKIKKYMSPNPCPHKPKPAQKSNQESLKTKTPPITPPNRQVGSQSFKRLGVIAVAMVGLCLLFYYLVGLYFWLTEKLPINFQPAFYFLGIVLPTSGFVHVGSKFANRTHPE